MSNGSEKKKERILQVTGLIQGLRKTVGRWPSFWVEGEVSNVSDRAGRIYFTLKDETNQISAWTRWHDSPEFKTLLVSGKSIQVLGTLGVGKRGDFQIGVVKIRPAGLGKLQQKFETLKKQLQVEGLLNPARRKPLPKLPRRIGIITSPRGDAVKDVVRNLLKRFPNLEIFIFEVYVEGDQAVPSITAQLDWLRQRGGRLDLFILTRGGGSLEQLWAFNEEPVVRAVADFPWPIVTGIGHEADRTLCDLVADHSEPTPTATANVVPRKVDLIAQLDQLEARRNIALRRRAQLARERWMRLGEHPVLRQASRLLDPKRQALRDGSARMRFALTRRMDRTRARLGRHTDTLPRLLQHLATRQRDRLRRIDQDLTDRLRYDLERKQQRLASLGRALHAYNPLQILERGFSITRRPDGKVLRSIAELEAGTEIETRLADGTVRSVVQESEMKGRRMEALRSGNRVYSLNNRWISSSFRTRE